MLGQVAPNGAIYFSTRSLNEARAFLRQHGLECPIQGWQSETHYGAIYHDGESIHAVHWQRPIRGTAVP